MGTALVMEHANALAQMIVSEKDKLFDERVEALVKLYRRAEFYLKQGFLESIVCEFHRKKVEIILGCICIALGIALSSYSLYNVWTTLTGKNLSIPLRMLWKRKSFSFGL